MTIPKAELKRKHKQLPLTATSDGAPKSILKAWIYTSFWSNIINHLDLFTLE